MKAILLLRLKAINGSHAIALAAKHYSVPVSIETCVHVRALCAIFRAIFIQ